MILCGCNGRKTLSMKGFEVFEDLPFINNFWNKSIFLSKQQRKYTFTIRVCIYVFWVAANLVVGGKYEDHLFLKETNEQEGIIGMDHVEGCMWKQNGLILPSWTRSAVTTSKDSENMGKFQEKREPSLSSIFVSARDYFGKCMSSIWSCIDECPLKLYCKKEALSQP